MLQFRYLPTVVTNMNYILEAIKTMHIKCVVRSYSTISKKAISGVFFFFVIKMEIARALPLPKLMHKNDQRDTVSFCSSLPLVRIKIYPINCSFRLDDHHNRCRMRLDEPSACRST
jgi:hypothetical protein